MNSDNKLPAGAGSPGMARAPAAWTPVALLLAAVVLASAGCGAPRKALSGSEMRSLLAGKTITGYHDKRKYSFVRYYDPAGTFRSYHNGSTTPQHGKWWVESGEICIQWDGEAEVLRRKIFTDGTGRYWKMLVKRNGKRIPIITYHGFVDGDVINRSDPAKTPVAKSPGSPTANIPRPSLVAIYALVIISTLVGSWLWVRTHDRTSDIPVPPVPDDPDPYELAFLRGGGREVAQAAVFALLQRGYLERTEATGVLSSSKSVARSDNAPDPRHLAPLEREVFGYFSSSRTGKDIVQMLPAVIQDYCEKYQQRLEANDLLSSAEDSSSSAPVRLAGSLIILGFMAFAAALRRTSGVMFGMTLVSLFILFAVSKTPRLTSRGRRYLQQIQLAHERLKASAASAEVDGKKADPALLLAVGLFGTGILAGTQHAYFNELFATSSHGGGSGGGGGCGGCGG